MGTYRLGGIEIDEDRRSVSAGGEEVAVQPLVFEFLAYLARHRDRAVGKEELLDRLWPGVTVTEASVQRLASVARGILKRGGAADALLSVPRFGYRLKAEAAAADPGPAEAGAGDLDAARRAAGENRWRDAVRLYAGADRIAPLAAEDLERFALSLECIGRPADAVPPLMRAVAARSEAGDRCGASAPALALSRIHLERGELSVARGWQRRAAELLAGAGECREHGLCAWMGGRLAAAEGEPEKALGLATEALAIGRRLGDPVVESLGLIYRGFFELCLGDTEKGLEDQNVAAALGLSSPIDPVVGGTLYCNILWACRNFADWSRASQWSLNYERWCAEAGIDLTGSCRLHRAEVLGVQGTLREAEERVLSAIELLRFDAPWATGDALRVLGDIHLAAGALDKAEEAYGGARAIGWDPQPGLALLQLERGDAEAANQGLERALVGRSWPTLQRRGLLLATLAKVAALTGRDARAGEIVAEIEGDPQRWPMASIRALAAEAKAALMERRGDLAGAIGALHRAAELWSEAEAPANCAAARLALARLLVAAGDPGGAGLEGRTAAAIAARLGSPRLAADCRALEQLLRP